MEKVQGSGLLSTTAPLFTNYPSILEPTVVSSSFTDERRCQM